jgi:hypothetical protein
MNLRAQIELITSPQDFTQLCNAVLIAEHGDDFLPIDDDRADRGNDGYVKSEKRMFAAHCFKRVQNQSIDGAIKTKMVGDLGKAIALKQAGIWDIEAWTFLTNYPISEELAESVVQIGRDAGIDVAWRGPDYFATALQERPELAGTLPGLQVNEISRQLAELQKTVEAAPSGDFAVTDGETPDQRADGSETSPEPSGAVPEPFSVPHSDEERARLVHARPPAWEYLLFAGLLSEGMSSLEAKWRDHELELPARQREHVDGDEVASRMSMAFGDLASIIEPLNRVFAGQEEAFGAPGEPGDPVRIEHLARWILAAYEDMLDWAAGLRAVAVPEQFERAVALTAKAADRPLVQFRAFVYEAIDQVGRIADHLSKPEEEQRETLLVELTLTVEADNDLMEEAVSELKRAIEG